MNNKNRLIFYTCLFLIHVFKYSTSKIQFKENVPLNRNDHKWKRFLFRKFAIDFDHVDSIEDTSIESSWKEMCGYKISSELFDEIIEKNAILGLLCVRFLSMIPRKILETKAIKGKFGKLTQRDCYFMDMEIFKQIDQTNVNAMKEFVPKFMETFLRYGEKHCIYRLLFNTFTKYNNLPQSIRTKAQNYSSYDPFNCKVCEETKTVISAEGHDMTETTKWLVTIGKYIQAYGSDSIANEIYYENMPYFELFSKLPTDRSRAIAFLRSNGVNRDLLLHLTKRDIQSIFSEAIWIYSFELYLRNVLLGLQRESLGDATIGSLVTSNDERPTALDMYSFYFDIINAVGNDLTYSIFELLWKLAISKNEAVGCYITEDQTKGIMGSSTMQRGLATIKSSHDNGMITMKVIENLHKFFAKISIQEWNNLLSLSRMPSNSKYVEKSSLSCPKERVKLSFLGPDILHEDVYDNISREDLMYVLSLMTPRDEMSLGILEDSLITRICNDSANNCPILLQSKQPWSNRLTLLLFHASLSTQLYQLQFSYIDALSSEKIFLLTSALLSRPKSIEEELKSISNDWTFLILNYWRLGPVELVKQFYSQNCTATRLKEWIASLRPSDMRSLVLTFDSLSKYNICMSGSHDIISSHKDLLSCIHSNLRLRNAQEDKSIDVVGLFNNYSYLFFTKANYI